MSAESEIRDAFAKAREAVERVPDSVSDVGVIQSRVAELSNAIEESFITLARQLDEVAKAIG